MINSIILDKKKRNLYKQFEIKRICLKAIRNNLKLMPIVRFRAQLLLQELPRNSSSSRVRNRCFLSGRSRGVYRRLKISRIFLRDMINTGKLPGFTKSSW